MRVLLDTSAWLASNEEEVEDAWQVYCQSKLTISWVDATVISISQKLVLPVFTFDRHFQRLKLKILPD